MGAEQTTDPLRVSVAMATFNGEEFIRDQLDSLAAQTALPSELVIVDDGSSDRTLAIVSNFAENAPFPVLVFSNDSRLGYGDNFLKAAALCSGSQIAFCDQDDIWNDRKIECSLELFADSRVVMTSHNALVIDEKGSLKSGRTFNYGRRKRVFVEKRYWAGYSGFTLVFRRRGLLSHILANESGICRNFRVDHDEVVSFVSMVCGRIGLSKDHLVCYRRHGTNATTMTEPTAGQSKASAILSSYRALRRRCLMAKKIFPTDFVVSEDGTNRPWVITALHLRRRLLVYAPRSRRGKLHTIATNFWMGVYGSQPKIGLGKRALIADILSAVGLLG